MTEKVNDLLTKHSEALEEFATIESSQRDEREQALQDRRFYSIAGAQWEGDLEDQFQGKPKFEVDKIHLSVIRIINDYRNNRVSVDFISKDGSNNEELADTCNGLMRSDEQDSNADEAYDNAFEEAVGGGFGAWRLRADYEDHEDDENEYQRIYIEPIYDADSCVFFDLGAKRQDKSDAKRCYVLTPYTIEDYKEEWGDDPATWPKMIGREEFDWNPADVVYVAEYYEVEQVKETINIFQGLDGSEERYSDKELTEELEAELLATGFTKVREKKVTKQKVHKYIMSGGKILEDCGYIAGKYIPIIPNYGKRWYVDNIERFMGHVRLAKDVARLKNMQYSKLAEISALSSVEKPILYAEEVAGFQTEWSEDNIKNYPYLRRNPMTDAGGNLVGTGIEYTRSPQIPPAMAALLQLTDVDMKEILGNQQAGEEIVSNISGKAVELIQNRLDMQSFIYVSNFAKAKKRSGEVWLSMAKDLYVEQGRKMKTLDDQDETSQVELNKPIVTDGGEVTYQYDLSKAEFGLAVDIGPTSSSKKAATVRALTGMMQISTDPETMQVLGAMAMMNMEGEGIHEVRDYFRQKLIRMGVVKPTKEEMAELQEEMASQPADPNSVYLEKAAQNEEAKAREAESSTLLNLVKVEETKAKTMKTEAEAIETLSGVSREEAKMAIEMTEALKTETA